MSEAEASGGAGANASFGGADSRTSSDSKLPPMPVREETEEQEYVRKMKVLLEQNSLFRGPPSYLDSEAPVKTSPAPAIPEGAVPAMEAFVQAEEAAFLVAEARKKEKELKKKLEKEAKMKKFMDKQKSEKPETYLSGDREPDSSPDS